MGDFDRPEQFVSHVAHKRGKLKAGGVPNLVAAAVTILKDWTSGTIPFYTLPPKNAANKEHESKAIVTGWAADFDINKLLDAHDTELSTMEAPTTNPKFIVTEASQPPALDMEETNEQDEDETNELDEDEDEDEDDEEEEDLRMEDEEESAEQPAETVQLDLKKLAKKGSKRVAKAEQEDLTKVPASEQRNKTRKKTLKKTKKKQRRQTAAMKE